jgi:hypothetical protein
LGELILKIENGKEESFLVPILLWIWSIASSSRRRLLAGGHGCDNALRPDLHWHQLAHLHHRGAPGTCASLAYKVFDGRPQSRWASSSTRRRRADICTNTSARRPTIAGWHAWRPSQASLHPPASMPKWCSMICSKRATPAGATILRTASKVYHLLHTWVLEWCYVSMYGH